MNIITQKKEKYNKSFEELNTFLKITINGDGSEVLDFSLPTPIRYTRHNKEVYALEYAIKGVFWTKKSNNFLNDILLRFNISMNVRNIETRIIGKSENLHELKSFSSSSNLDSLTKKIFVPKTEKYQDSIFWGLKLFTEFYIKENSFLSYSTLENYAFNHYVDLAKDKSTLRAKCRSIWAYYEAREWQPQTQYTKKTETEVMATRLEHVENLAKQKRKLTEHKIKSAIDFLKSENQKITAVNIAKYSKISRQTIAKYKHLWK